MEDGGRKEGSRISREVGQARHSDSERGIIITCRRGNGGGAAVTASRNERVHTEHPSAQAGVWVNASHTLGEGQHVFSQLVAFDLEPSKCPVP